MQQGVGKLSESYQEKNLQNLLNITMTDPERSKGRKKGSTKVRMKGKKVQFDNTAKEQEAPDVLICNGCKEIFTDENTKMICCDRCQKWYCTKCMNITDAFYSFLVSKEAEDVVWFCKVCKEPAKKAIIEDKCIEDRCKEYIKKINEKLRSLEVDLLLYIFPPGSVPQYGIGVISKD